MFYLGRVMKNEKIMVTNGLVTNNQYNNNNNGELTS